MEIRQLTYFAEVAHVGSFLGAAEELGVAQPSLWRQVKALEKELGIPLFERSGRRVKLTSAGVLLLERAEQVLRQAERVLVLGKELRQGRSGVVTIGCASPHVQRFIAPLVGGFHVRHPDIHVALHEAPGLPDSDELLIGDVDFMTSLPRRDDRLTGRQLGEARVVVITGDDHPWRRRERVEVSELAGVPVLVGPQRSLTRRLLEPALLDHGLTLDIALEANTITTPIALARAGLGVAVVGDDHLPDDVSASPWPLLWDEQHQMSTPIWLYWSRTRTLAPPVQQFARYVHEATKPGTHHEANGLIISP